MSNQEHDIDSSTSADPPTEEGIYEVWHIDAPYLVKERRIYKEDGDLMVDVPKNSLIWSVARRNPKLREYDTKSHFWRGPLEKTKI